MRCLVNSPVVEGLATIEHVDVDGAISSNLRDLSGTIDLEVQDCGTLSSSARDIALDNLQSDDIESQFVSLSCTTVDD